MRITHDRSDHGTVSVCQCGWRFASDDHRANLRAAVHHAEACHDRAARKRALNVLHAQLHRDRKSVSA